MKNSEEAIAKVLAGLRDAEAPDGMEGRILMALEDEPMRSRAMWRRRPMWMVVPENPVVALSLACGLALAGVFVVALAMPAIRRFGHAPAASSAQSSARLKSNSALDSPTPATVAVGTDAELHSGPSLRRLGTTNVRAKANAGSTKVARDSDSLGRNEMHDASFPAPPMPLTEQERLLLQIAHKGDPVEVAELDSKQRDQKGLKEKVEYLRFFARPPIEQPAAPQEELPPEKAAEVQQTTPQATPEQSRTGDNR